MQDRPVRLHQGWTERKAGVREGLQELHVCTRPYNTSTGRKYL